MPDIAFCDRCYRAQDPAPVSEEFILPIRFDAMLEPEESDYQASKAGRAYEPTKMKLCRECQESLVLAIENWAASAQKDAQRRLDHLKSECVKSVKDAPSRS